MARPLSRPLEEPTREYIAWLEARVRRAEDLCRDLAHGGIDPERARARAAAFVAAKGAEHPAGV